MCSLNQSRTLWRSTGEPQLPSEWNQGRPAWSSQVKWHSSAHGNPEDPGTQEGKAEPNQRMTNSAKWLGLKKVDPKSAKFIQNRPKSAFLGFLGSPRKNNRCEVSDHLVIWYLPSKPLRFHATNVSWRLMGTWLPMQTGHVFPWPHVRSSHLSAASSAKTFLVVCPL